MRPVIRPATRPAAARWSAAGALVLAAMTAVVAAVGWTVITAAPAAAHATLVSTSPVRDEVVTTAPTEVVLRFDEPVTTGLGGVRVIGPDGRRADQGSLSSTGGDQVLRRPVAAVGRGTYTVAFRVQSADGHTVEGSFVYHVGERTGAAVVETGTAAGVDVVGVVGRWLAAAGTVVVLGALGLVLLERRSVAPLTGLVALAGVAVAVGSTLDIVAHTAEAAGRGLFDIGDVLGTAVLDDRSGFLLAVRWLGGVLVAASWWWRRARESWIGALALGAAVLVGAAASSGHAWSAERRWLAVAADAVHLVVVGAWAGGLVALLVVLRRGVGSGVVQAFSTMAVGAAPAAAITGLASASGQLAGPSELWGSAYGRLVLAKVVLFVVLVALGAHNRLRIVPALDAALDRLRRNVRVEIGVVAVVLGVTAALVATTPARDVQVPFFGTRVSDGIALTLTVDPARPGVNQIHGSFSSLSGQIGAARVDAVELTVASADVPARVVPVELVTADHFVASQASLGPGTWTVTVTAVRRGTVTTTTFEVVVR
jgi:copper transport protein